MTTADVVEYVALWFAVYAIGWVKGAIFLYFNKATDKI